MIGGWGGGLEDDLGTDYCILRSSYLKTIDIAADWETISYLFLFYVFLYRLIVFRLPTTSNDSNM